METTGIFWFPLFFKIKAAGIDVILVNAHEVKNKCSYDETKVGIDEQGTAQ